MPVEVFQNMAATSDAAKIVVRVPMTASKTKRFVRKIYHG